MPLPTCPPPVRTRAGDLTNHEATPGAGALPGAGEKDATNSTSG